MANAAAESLEKEWVNWSGSLRFTPGRLLKPQSEEEIAELIRQAAAGRTNVRVVGAGHSSTPLVQTRDLLVSLEKMKGLLGHDPEKCQATILPGFSVGEAGAALQEVGMAMHNTGDVDMQLVSGAIGTGTHGTGRTLPNLSCMLAGVRLVNGKGELMDFSVEKDKEMMDAIRVSMGTFGIFTQLHLQLMPAYRVHRQEWCTNVDQCLGNLDQLEDENRHVDFYWYPRSDEVKLRTVNLEDEGYHDIPYAKLLKDQKGWVNEILPQTRELKYEEMEYALPAEAGPECFREVRKRVLDRHRQYVAWRVLYRMVAADESFLSPFYGRESVTIAILQNSELEYWKYFKDIEPIFRHYGGRPHWGKKHTLKAAELKPLFPLWDRFMELRRTMDPDGVFLNTYMKELLGE